jgi:23S rRNA (cytidine2498-2'-O)-methyltransferase
MHVLLVDEGTERFLIEELRRAYPGARNDVWAPGIVASDFVLQDEAPPILVFARQLLPEATECEAASVSAWAERLFAEVVARVPADQPWRLHVAPCYGHGHAGQNRCRLIREGFTELLRRKRRQWLRCAQTEPTPFPPADTLVQVLLTAPERGWLAVAVAPRPYQLRRVITPFPKGEIPVASDKAAPSRAFAKLVEAELRLDRRIAAGETCVDLGAAPGSWTYVALQRGARVIAVDRAPLRPDLMRSPRLRFQKGDAFRFQPDAPVDWLLCDVIAAPERSIGLVLDWVRHRRARHFVVTIKFKGETDYPLLEQLKHALPPLCEEFHLTRLSANKNEACVFGTVK